jgi:holo-[acyl-carrier protein] synthase
MNTGSVFGVDIVSIPRMRLALERSGRHFAERIFTEEELLGQDEPGFLATRFAAKEAFFKALGTGLSGGVRWHDFSLPTHGDGAPTASVSGRSAVFLAGRSVFTSVSRTSDIAVAVVFLEGSGGCG